jgi:hypothetical protein
MQAPSNLIRASGMVVRLGGVLGIVLGPILVYLWTTRSDAYLTYGGFDWATAPVPVWTASRAESASAAVAAARTPAPSASCPPS